MKQLPRCIHCGNQTELTYDTEHRAVYVVSVYCPQCHARGPRIVSQDGSTAEHEAIARYNEAAKMVATLVVPALQSHSAEEVVVSLMNLRSSIASGNTSLEKDKLPGADAALTLAIEDWNILIFKAGTQIIYVPDHAEGDVNHPDCEKGFVTSVRGDVAFCRYWSKFHEGLRTVANSEATPIRNLVVHDSIPQSVIDAWLEGRP